MASPVHERLDYEVGQSVHWRLINASDLSHPMHLHGSTSSSTAQATESTTTLLRMEKSPWSSPIPWKSVKPLRCVDSERTRPLAVSLSPDSAYEAPGCHRPERLRPTAVVLAGGHEHEHMHDMNSEYDGMGGMIMGVTVTGRRPWTPPRTGSPNANWN